MTATGLRMQMIGGIEICIDGRHFDPHDSAVYKGVLSRGLPNAMILVGSTNASWTLKIDIAAEYFTRLVTYINRHDHRVFVARADPSDLGDESIMGSARTSGYIQRSDPGR